MHLVHITVEFYINDLYIYNNMPLKNNQPDKIVHSVYPISEYLLFNVLPVQLILESLFFDSK